MERRKRVYIFLTFFICTTCLAMLTTSLATHKWLVAKPIRIISFNSTKLMHLADERTEKHELSKFTGVIYFGLFQGTKILNYGLGDRTAIIWLKQEMSRNPNLMAFSFWLLTILSVSIAMIFGLVGAIFSIINTVMTPMESITGVQGLYLWNTLAGFFCACATISWLWQFQSRLSENVMTEEEQKDGWKSQGRASLGYSFYLVLSSLSLHLFNIILTYYGTRTAIRKERTIGDKHPEGLIMLY